MSPPWWRKQGFLLFLGLTVCVAWLKPDLAAPGGALRADKWNWAIPPALFAISGLLLPSRRLALTLLDWRLHAFTQGFSLLLMPLVFGMASQLLVFAHFHSSLSLGLIVLGALSTTTTSAVVLTRTAGGDEAGALFNATLGSFLGVVASPWLIGLFARPGEALPILPVMGHMAAQTLLPFAIGQGLRRVLRQGIEAWKPTLRLASLTLLLLMIGLAIATGFLQGFRTSKRQILAIFFIVAALHVGSLALAFFVSGLQSLQLDKAKRTAALLCCTQKSAALGLPLITVLYRHDTSLGLIALPLLIYHPIQLISASLLLPHLARWNQGQAASPDTGHMSVTGSRDIPIV